MKVIYERRSIRSYEPEQISKEQLNLILDTGLWAPTARNEQEIKFVAIQNKAMLDELQSDFMASMSGDSRVFHYNAPTYFILFGPKDFHYTDIDGGIAVENMALAAESLGLSSVIIGIIRNLMDGPEGDKWFNRFGIPRNYKFIISLAVGIKAADTPKRERKKDRIVNFL